MPIHERVNIEYSLAQEQDIIPVVAQYAPLDGFFAILIVGVLLVLPKIHILIDYEGGLIRHLLDRYGA